jgi:hypothetical protein
MPGFARLTNLVGYLFLTLGLILANARLALTLDPTRDVLLSQAGWCLAGLSAATFIIGLAVQSAGWFARLRGRCATPR